jgi:transposase-like protein
MGTFKFIPREIKEQILKRIKEEGITVAQAAIDAGISSKTIYNWMRSKNLSDGSVLEISRLRRENRELAEIIGHLTHNLTRSKKN